MQLDRILEHNRSFVLGRAARPLAAPETLSLAIVACYDPRLDELLPAALGIVREQTIFLRAAGALVRPEGEPLRSLAMAVYMFGVTEILVVGHTSCRMAAFSAAGFIDMFRARGVTRDAFGPTDLREWAGAIPDVRRGVQSSAAAIASAPFLPRDVTLAGLVLDDASGALELVVRPGTIPVPAAAPAPTPEPAAAVREPPRGGPPPSAASAEPLAAELEAIRSFLASLESAAGWREELARLRSDLERQGGAAARLGLVEKFLRRSAGTARGVASAFERLVQETDARGLPTSADRLLDLFRRAGRNEGA